MKTSFLFPNQCKRIGWIFLVPSAILGFFVLFFDFEFEFFDLKMFSIYAEGFKILGDSSTFFGVVDDNLTNEAVGILFLMSAMLVAFSKEKQEDEFISNTRLQSLLWATYINYAILIICNLFFFNTIFLYVLILNMFTTIIFFIIRFNYILYKEKKLPSL